MRYITIKEAQIEYNKSLSSIRRVILRAAPREIKNGILLNTGLHQKLISTDFLNTQFGTPKHTENINPDTSLDIVAILQKELSDKQKTIDKMFEHQSSSDSTIKKLTENEEKMLLLLERADERAKLFKQYFDSQTNIEPTKKEAYLISEIQEAEVVENEKIDIATLDNMPNDPAEFSVWIQRFNESKNK